MADVNEREVFSVLQDANKAGTPLDLAVNATTAAAALQGLVGFAFQDSTGKVILPTLTSDGKISVDTEAFSGVQKKINNKAIVAALNTPQVIATLTGLTTTKTVEIQKVLGSSTQSCFWQVIQTDNATPTILTEFVTGPGQFSYTDDLGKMQFVTGGTGTQKIEISVSQLNGKLSDAHATIVVKELGAS